MTYHDSGAYSYSSSAVSVRHNVTEAHRQEGDGNEPHGIQEVGVLLVMKPTTANQSQQCTTMNENIKTTFDPIYKSNPYIIVLVQLVVFMSNLLMLHTTTIIHLRYVYIG